MYRLYLFPIVLVLLPALPRAASGEEKFSKEVKEVLDKAKSIELLSLDPEMPDKKPKNDFHGYKVLGKVELKKKERDRIVKALYKGVSDSDGAVAGCFNPRHGIKAAGPGGKTVELVICFECLSMQVYVNGKSQKGVLTANGPASTFNQVLKDNKVPLPKQPDD